MGIKSNARRRAGKLRAINSANANFSPLIHLKRHLLSAVFAAPLALFASGAVMALDAEGCARDGATVNCQGGLYNPETQQFGVSENEQFGGLVTDTVNVNNFSGTSSSSNPSIFLRQSGDITINIQAGEEGEQAGKQIDQQLIELAGGADGNLTLVDFQAFITGLLGAGEDVGEFSEPEFVAAAFGSIDTDQDGNITPVQLFQSFVVNDISEEIEEAIDQAGRVPVAAIIEAVGDEVGDADVKAFIAGLNVDDNGTVAVEEALASAAAFAVQNFDLEQYLADEGEGPGPAILANHGAGAVVDAGSLGGTVSVTNDVDLLSRQTGINVSSGAPAGFLGPDAIPGGAVTVNNSGDIIIDEKAVNQLIAGFGEEFQPEEVQISGDRTGIEAASVGGDVTVTNSGDINVADGQSRGITAQSDVGNVTVDNAGDITVLGGLKVGGGLGIGIVALSDVGNVSVVNAGDINAVDGADGIFVAGGTGTLTVDNSGSITASDVGIDGFLYGDGAINILNSGNINAGGDGLFVESMGSGAITIENSGNLTAGFGGIDSKNNGAAAQIVGNTGDITITGEQGAGIGVEGDGFGGIDLTNSGAILLKQSGVGIKATTGLDEDVTPGIGNVTVDNSGEIQAANGNSFGIFAGSDPGDELGGQVQITTSGNIIATGVNSFGIFGHGSSSSTIAINIVGADTTVSGGSGSQELAFALPVLDENGEASRVGFTSSAGIMVIGGSDNVINNAGLITAVNGLAINAFDGELDEIEFAQDQETWEILRDDEGNPLTVKHTMKIAAADETVNNDGTITGDIALGNGDNTLNNNAGGVVTGNLTTGSGVDTVKNSGTITGDADLGDGGNFFTNLLGGIFGGNVTTGADNDTVVNAGGMVGNANLGDGTNSFENTGGFQGELTAGAGDDTATNSGVFDGNVNLGGGSNSFTNLAGGVFAPGSTVNVGKGNSVVNAGNLLPGGNGVIQTTSITGNFTQTASGAIGLDINDKAAAKTDQLLVSGTADLNGKIVPNIVNLSDGDQQFTIVIADGGATDSGLAAVNVADTVGFDFEILFDGNNVILTSSTSNSVTEILEDATTGLTGSAAENAGSVAKVLDESASQSPALQQLVTALRALPDTGSVAEAVERLTPKAQASATTGAVTGVASAGNAMLSCQVRDGDHKYTREGQCYWAKVTVRRLDRDATKDHSGVEEDGVEVMGGLQWALWDELRLGVALGYADTESDSMSQTQKLGSSDGERFTAGLVLKNQWGPINAYLNLVGSYGSYDLTRIVGLGFGNAQAEQDVTSFMTRLRVSYLMDGSGLYMRPMVDLNATYVSLDGYRERGAGAANLVIGSTDEWFLSVTPAVEIGGETRLGNDTVVRPYLRGGVTFIDQDSMSVDVNFAGAPAGVQPFTVNSELEDMYGVVEAGLHILTPEGFNFKLSYDGRFAEDSQEHAGTLKVGKNF